MERLLSDDEVNEILKIAELNPELKYPNAFNLGETKTSIIKITPKCGLILIQGDSYTGFTHIRERHSYWSEKTFWKKDSEGKIESPSQFGEKSMPIIDYIEILDGLYHPDNLNIIKNKNPQTFEMYSGYSISKNLGKEKYHLLLYKNTKIVHTLYPNTKKKNRKKIIDYERGKPEGRYKFSTNLAVIGVPYSNQSGKVIYSFQVIFDYNTKLETGMIVDHKTQKISEVYNRPIEKFIFLTELVQDFEIIDLAPVEKLIKQLDGN